MGMREEILSLKDQVLSRDSVDFDPKKFKSVIVAGMGGSGIAGHILADIYDRVPVIPLSGYNLPAFADSSSLVIAISYSGNTEETISCFDQARERGCPTVAITSGGTLSRSSGTVIKIPGGLQPRSAIGYMIMPLLRSFMNIGDQDAARIRSAIVSAFDREVEIKRLAEEMASGNRTPIILGTPEFRGVALRWKTQFNENSKVVAYSTFLPEANHNDTAWMPSYDEDRFKLIAFRSIDPRINLRIDLTQKITGRKFHVIGSDGTLIERIFFLIAYGDLLSYLLGVLRGIDPLDVSVLSRLKEGLASSKR